LVTLPVVLLLHNYVFDFLALDLQRQLFRKLEFFGRLNVLLYLPSFVDGLTGLGLSMCLRIVLCNDGFELTDGLLVFDALHFLHVPH